MPEATQPNKHSKDGQYSTPILVIFFNREEYLKRLLERIREIAPCKLYLAADGPRADRPGEAEKCDAIRKMALSMIDWPCDARTLFRAKNIGCGLSVSGAISWFFENEPEGIVLEDDCLVDKSFFRFASEMLERYRDDERIGVISAMNIAGTDVPFRHSYAFSRLFSGLWGWASWRRVWKDFDIDFKILPELEANDEMFFARDFHERWFISTSLKGIKEIGGYNTWDYQVTFANLINSRLSVVPNVNLVHNLGNGGDATHDQNQILVKATSQAFQMSFPLSHPPYVMANSRYDDFYKKSIMQKAPSCLWRFMKWVQRAINRNKS